jgi:flagellar hook protein FlgE
MSFSTALSGLNAASNNLTIIGNNIANANTYGFKASRAEFVDSYAANVAGTGNLQPGTGVRLAQVAQQFTQGNSEATGNELDMEINGEGFFTLAATPDEVNARVYSRNGSFHVNKDGIVVNNQGQALLAYKPNGLTITDGFSSGEVSTVSLNIGAGKPVATSLVTFQANLDATSPAIPNTVTFDPLNDDTYTDQSPSTVYDSLGVPHRLTTYFVANAATPPTRSWTVHHYITDDGVPPVSLDTTPPATITFDSAGELISPADGKLTLAPYSTGTAAASIDITMDLKGTTQLNNEYAPNILKQNGLPAGTFTDIKIDDQGVILANFSNGGSSPLGRIVMTRFTNPQGLSKLGDGAWAETSTSGAPLSGAATEGIFGAIQSGSLEQSNVDLTKQLVSLIVAQQTYQANSQTIQTENSSIQTILQLG